LKYLHLISEAMALPSLKRSPKNSSLQDLSTEGKPSVPKSVIK